MHETRVGALYASGVTRWPEGAEFSWDANGASLVLRFSRPSPREIEAARAGKAEFAMMVDGDVLWILFRFGQGAIPWSDCPFSWHLVPEGRRQIPPLENDESRAAVTVILLDADTGIVQAIRLVTLSPDFTRRLLNAIRIQASTPWPGRAAYDAQIAAAYARYPDTASMVRACPFRCEGGA